MSVRWECSISKGFNVTNSVRQDGVLSSKLFNVYIDGLSNILNNFTTGGFLGGKRINHMLYADMGARRGGGKRGHLPPPPRN